MRDPGGRLGPYIGPKGGPDLRNLGLFMTLCEQDSLVFILSDGVHDNLDPEVKKKNSSFLFLQELIRSPEPWANSC